MAIKIMLVIFLLLCVIGAGIVAGMFFGLFGDDFEITKEELKIGASNSVVVDSNGGVIANLSGDEKRKVIKLEDMADYLPKAYVAIEDERFYKHNGVDLKRTAGAILHTVTGNSSYGGSTITQQLVKNITKDDESSGLAGIFRKVKEWAKAYQVERMISKDQILELYLNILYVGGEGNLHGVELGAEYYFNKSAKDLSLAECAFLAGINSSPNYYNPYKLASSNDTEEKRDERIKSKVLTVLAKMKELGYIQNEEEYNEAVKQAEEGLKFEKAAIATGTTYSYHTDAVIDQVINQVMDEKDISRQLAENYVYSSGLTIHSTVDSTIQARLEEEYAKEKYKKTSPSKKQTTQSGMAIIDYKTGTKQFKLSDILYGINLQMLLYLHSIEASGGDKYGEIVPAGILYMPATVPYISSDSLKSIDKLPDELNKKLKMNGLLLKDTEIIHGMDKTDVATYIPVKIKAGEPVSSTSLATLAEFGKIFKKVDMLIAEMGKNIYNGNIEAKPLKGGHDSCEYCPYDSVCAYRQSNPITCFSVDNKTVIEEITNEINGKEEE